MKYPMLCIGALLAVATPLSAQWSDNFDTYANGTLLDNVGGWQGWDNTSAAAGTATNKFFRSAPNSIEIGAAADAVHPGLGATSGAWTLRAWQYIPTGSLTANTWLIINNQYNSGSAGAKAWACQFRAESANGNIVDGQAAGRTTNTVPVIFDRWVEWRLDIDLDANTIVAHYDGQLISQGTYVTATTAPIAIENIDLYSQGSTCYWDDISLEGNAWSDDFESYANGTLLDNVGGWQGWDNTPAAAGTVSTAFARSGNNSIEIGAAADAVHPGFNLTSGRWVLRGWQYIPTGSLTANSWLIVNNQYNSGSAGAKAWACQFRAESANGNIVDGQAAGRVTNTMPVIFDKWVEWRLEIDLDQNTIAAYYDGNQISRGTYVTATTAPVAIANIDLYSQGSTCYWDDLSIHRATDNHGVTSNQGATSTDTTVWVSAPEAANSLTAMVIAGSNASPRFPIPGLLDGFAGIDGGTMILLAVGATDANGRASLTAPVPTLGTSFKLWSQAYSLLPSGLLMPSDPVAISDGDDGASDASIGYNPVTGRYTAQYKGANSAVVTLLPANTVVADFSTQGHTGVQFLAAGQSLVVTDKTTNKELTRVTYK